MIRDDRLAVSVDEAARMVGLSSQTIRQEVNTLRLPASRIGRTIRIKVADLNAWLDAQEQVR